MKEFTLNQPRRNAFWKDPARTVSIIKKSPLFYNRKHIGIANEFW